MERTLILPFREEQAEVEHQYLQEAVRKAEMKEALASEGASEKAQEYLRLKDQAAMAALEEKVPPSLPASLLCAPPLPFLSLTLASL